MKKLNRKILLGGVAILFALGFIVISSFFPFIIDPKRWQNSEFLSDELIICAIVAFGTIASLFIGQASNAQDERSEIARSKVAFQSNVEKVTDYNRFWQWVRKVLQPSDTEEMKRVALQEVGLTDTSLLELSLPELKNLIDTPQKYGNTFYHSITERQFKRLQRIKERGVYKDFVEPNYYLVAKTGEPTKTMSEKAGSEGRRKVVLLSYSLISKIVVTVITSMIFASLVYDTTKDGVEQAEAWLKFISRVFALSTSAFMGYMVGVQTNNIDADSINDKITVLKRYMQDTSFRAKDQQELAKEEFVERVKKENREYGERLMLGGSSNGSNGNDRDGKEEEDA